MAYPNFVTKSQRCAKSCDLYEKQITCFSLKTKCCRVFRISSPNKPCSHANLERVIEMQHCNPLRWRPHSFRTNYSVNSQAFVLMATLTISLKEKITSEVKFAEQKSALLQNNVWKKILPFVPSYKVTPPLHHPKNNFKSKWHLIQPLQRKMYKNPTLISYILVWSKNLS